MKFTRIRFLFLGGLLVAATFLAWPRDDSFATRPHADLSSVSRLGTAAASAFERFSTKSHDRDVLDDEKFVYDGDGTTCLKSSDIRNPVDSMLRLITERHVLAYYGLSVEDAALINDEILDYVQFVVNTIDDQLVIEEVDGVLYYSYEGDLEFGLEKREALFNMFSEVGGEEFAKNASEKFRNSSHLFEFGMVSFVGRFAAEDAPPMPDFPPEGFWVNFEGKMYAPYFPDEGKTMRRSPGPNLERFAVPTLVRAAEEFYLSELERRR